LTFNELRAVENRKPAWHGDCYRGGVMKNMRAQGTMVDPTTKPSFEISKTPILNFPQ
jgi:hypothetical protein